MGQNLKRLRVKEAVKKGLGGEGDFFTLLILYIRRKILRTSKVLKRKKTCIFHLYVKTKLASVKFTKREGKV